MRVNMPIHTGFHNNREITENRVGIQMTDFSLILEYILRDTLCRFACEVACNINMMCMKNISTIISPKGFRVK